MENISKSGWIKLSMCGLAFAICVFVFILLVIKRNEPVVINVNWDPQYQESSQEYDKYNLTYEDWDIYVPDSSDVFTAVTVDESVRYLPTEVFTATSESLTNSDEEIISLSEDEAWQLISHGIFDTYPNVPYKSIKSEVQEIQRLNTETITVHVWYWANPKDDTDMSKVTKTLTVAVNSAISDLFRHIFEDIYNHPSKPVINLSDAGMGTWVLRGKNHNDNNTLSSHSIGAAIDLNPSTGSFYVNGVWYGNAYGQKAMSYSTWCQLPECHKKYHVLYTDSPIVQIFKSYGFYWGGDWASGTDCMHFAFIGDGKNARTKGQDNYAKYSQRGD